MRHSAEIGDFGTIEAAQIYGVTTRRVERFCLEYDRHRCRFETIDEPMSLQNGIITEFTEAYG